MEEGNFPLNQSIISGTKEVCMVPPAPADPQIEHSDESSADLLGGVQATSRVLRTFGFHVLAVLLGIALAFM